MEQRPTIIAVLIALASLIFQPSLAIGQGLRVSPVTFEVTAPGATANLTLRNEGATAITVQSRVFAWSQNGQEQLKPTRDVVVSPPITKLAPGAVQTVRIVRTSRAAVRGEEAYRVFVDELPDQSRHSGGTVAFVTRLRLPVFFVQRAAKVPSVTWRIRQQGTHSWLEATNHGQVHLKLANVSLRSGNTVAFRRDGLFGYALGGSKMRWPLATRIRGGKLSLHAKSSIGPYRATVAGR